MFKKAVEAKSQQRLSGADRKKLRRIAKERFVNATDADIDLIIPPKSEITAIKFPNRVHVYGIEGGFPMLFDVDGRGADVFPTVYALWKAPNLLPAFTLKGGEVSHFIIGGADLMFPGIRIPEEGLPSFLAGQPWSVKVPGNLAPIAVGSTNMTSAEAVKAGLRGKALLISHCYKDFLWESAEGHYVPNAGFLEDMVLDDPALDSQRDPSNYLANDHQNGVTTGQEGEFPEVANAHSEDLEKNGLPEGIISDLSGLNVEVNGSVEELNGEKEQHALSTDEVDSLLDTCLLQALHTTVKDKDLPMPGSSLWSCHVLPCRPSGITLDIKKSSHKKLSKWLQSKSSVGLISSKEDKHKKEIVLLAINRKHADYMSFRPEKRKVEPIECSSDAKASESAPQKFQLELTEIYKPSVHVNPIFTSLGLDTGRLFTAAEATDVVFSYIENANLVKPTNKAVVVLDAILCDALYKGSIKKGSAYPTEIHKKDLGFTFINRMQAHHRVTRANETVVRKGALKTVQIMTERRQGNKKVTRVWGFESFLIDAESLASELQKKCACSTTVTELPGKKGFEVLIQGGVIGELAKYLVDRYGIPKRYIEMSAYRSALQSQVDCIEIDVSRSSDGVLFALHDSLALVSLRIISKDEKEARVEISNS
ncbi:hypothetical protein GIB67_037135 [Kingdonia uniflora]|uniref:glycerophosphodiester phosphodiesterase n=1 Tax=Kingdonia uniflora TaxID=39325 RepID=A0A7J7LHV5_9MAGN|nr:hypothetical protein GIB67_037135 [Kingdonia uniflora]